VVRIAFPGVSRLAVAAALVAALGLTGCGRKGGLDPPPTAGAAAVELTEDGQPLPSTGPASRNSAKKAAPGQPPLPKSFILDWLVD
jgi:predicted small lipoprotein YifL